MKPWLKSWRERVIEAERRGTFTKKDKRLSREWGQCAVGEQQALYPGVVLYSWLRDSSWFSGHGGPEDNTLWALGLRFNNAVQMEYIPDASRLLDQIEDRVLQLKREA